MIFPDDYLMLIAFVFVSLMLVGAVVDHFRVERKAKREDGMRQEVYDFVENFERVFFIAVRGQEWRWEKDPWMDVPWRGTKYEAYYDEIFNYHTQPSGD